MDYEKLMFVAKDIRFGFFYILFLNFVAFIDRRSFYKRFCNDNSIQENAINKKYLPNKYLVEHDRILRLGKSRDRIIAQIYQEYKNKSLNTEYAINLATKDIAEKEKEIEDYQKTLLETKKKASSEKDPAEAIYLQSVVSNLDTSIKNQKIVLQEKEGHYAELLGVKVNNDDNWENQLKQIEDEVDACTMNFIRRLGRKVNKKLGFSNFYYVVPEYSEKVKQIKEMTHASSSNKK